MTSFKSPFFVLLGVIQILAYCRGSVFISPDGNLGEVCDNENPCNNPYELVCQAGICVCNNDHVEFDKMCLKKATHIGDECQEDIQCTVNLGQNTLCGGEGIGCFCLPGFVPSSDRTKCLKVADYLGEACEETEQCREGVPGVFSECSSDSTCQCTSEAVSEPGQHVCLKKADQVGDACAADVQCAVNLGSLSKCNGEQCYCIPGSVSSLDNNVCLPLVDELGESCLEPQQCQLGTPGSYSNCVGGKCECGPEGVNEPDEHYCYKKAELIGDDCSFGGQCTANLGEFSECQDDTKKCGCIDDLGVPSNNMDTCLIIINHLETEECAESQQCQAGLPGELSNCLASASNPDINVCRCKEEAVNRPGHHVCLKKAQQLGDSCEENIQCHAELTEWSYCLRGMCACIETISVPSKNNDTCLEIIHDLDNGTCEESQQCQHGIPGEFSECVPSKDDPTKNVCMCTDEAVNETGCNKCLRKAKLVGDSCEADIQCTANLGDLSSCLSGECLCIEGVSIPGKDNDTCLEIINNLMGDICQESQQCQSGTPGQLSDCLPLQNDSSKAVCQCSGKGANIPGEHVCLEYLAEPQVIRKFIVKTSTILNNLNDLKK